VSRHQAVRKFAETRQTKKELEILSVASDYFLSHGYQGTSINAMARDSGISKESIYRYFPSKKMLFEAVITKELAEYQQRLHSVDLEFDSISLEEALRKTAESILSAVTADRTLALRRLIFQETRQSPDIGQYYYESGPEEAYRNLEIIFDMHERKSTLPSEKLANYFVAMVLHKLMLKRQCGVDAPLDKDAISEHAANATRDFLEAFVN
jgi:TetR/AcrR family transcriptional repressor of mexJK operon